MTRRSVDGGQFWAESLEHVGHVNGQRTFLEENNSGETTVVEIP